eukprot:UN13558
MSFTILVLKMRRLTFSKAFVLTLRSLQVFVTGPDPFNDESLYQPVKSPPQAPILGSIFHGKFEFRDQIFQQKKHCSNLVKVLLKSEHL